MTPRRITEAQLRCALGIGPSEWRSVRRAAADAQLTTRAYCRLMRLCAAGHGGVIEHMERAVAASFEAYADTK